MHLCVTCLMHPPSSRAMTVDPQSGNGQPVLFYWYLIVPQVASGSLLSSNDDKASAGSGTVHSPVLNRW